MDAACVSIASIFGSCQQDCHFCVKVVKVDVEITQVNDNSETLVRGRSALNLRQWSPGRENQVIVTVVSSLEEQWPTFVVIGTVATLDS